VFDVSDKQLIIVVESGPVSGPRIRRALPEDSFEVIEVATPQEAVEAIARMDPALVCISTDYGAEAVYGFCNKLVKYGFAVVLLERRPTRESVIRATRYGALDVFLHPPRREVILPRVKKALVKSGKALPEADEKPPLPLTATIKEPRARVEYVIKQAESLLALPHAVSAVLRLCAQPDTSAKDLVGPIESDSAIAASVLRLANSAAMASAHRVTGLQNAIARIGIKATSNLAMAQSVFKMFKRQSNTFGFDRTEFWMHSLGAACCARALGHRWRGMDPDDAFMAGLLHDLGKMVLDEHLPVEYQQAVKNANVKKVPIRVGERQTFEVDHAFVGIRIAKQWDLPEHVCRAVASHHRYERLTPKGDGETAPRDPSLAVTRCTSLANQLAKAFGFGHAGDFFVEPESLGIWQALRDVRLDIPKLYASALEELMAFLSLLRVPTGDLSPERPEPKPERVLLCLPEDEPPYQALLEGFFARLGYATVTQPSLDQAPAADGPFVMAVASVSGSYAVVEHAAARLLELAPSGIVFAPCPEIPKEGLGVNGNVHALGRMLDFYVLSKTVKSAISAAPASS